MADAFLTDASSRARSGTPWATGALPSAVYASSPGFNPTVAKLLGSINAQATGQSSADFLRTAQKYTPQGVNESITRRTQ